MNKLLIKRPKLRKDQEEAINFFNKNGYLVIEAARQTGKTTVLQEIIKRNEDKMIGIVAYSYEMYQFSYKALECKNVKYLGKSPSEKEFNAYNFDIILGDEVFVEPFSFNGYHKSIKTACAWTPRYIVKGLAVPKSTMSHLKRIKKSLSKNHFEMEYGKYLNKK